LNWSEICNDGIISKLNGEVKLGSSNNFNSDKINIDHHHDDKKERFTHLNVLIKKLKYHFSKFFENEKPDTFDLNNLLNDKQLLLALVYLTNKSFKASNSYSSKSINNNINTEFDKNMNIIPSSFNYLKNMKITKKLKNLKKFKILNQKLLKDELDDYLNIDDLEFQQSNNINVKDEIKDYLNISNKNKKINNKEKNLSLWLLFNMFLNLKLKVFSSHLRSSEASFKFNLKFKL
jgi:hypothetical protein